MQRFGLEARTDARGLGEMAERMITTPDRTRVALARLPAQAARTSWAQDPIDADRPSGIT